MDRYYALLRGVNVGGKNKINMKDLALSLENIGLLNVKTYLQSGNIIFESEKMDRIMIAKGIERCIKSTYNYEVPAIILKKEELINIKNGNLYKDCDTKKCYFSFLYETPDGENVRDLEYIDIGEDEFEVVGNIIYVYYNTSAGTSKLNNSLIERKLKVRSTMRNYNTITNLIEKY